MIITDTDGRQHELSDAYVPAAVRRLRSSGRGNRVIDLGGDRDTGPVTVSDEEAGRIVAEYRARLDNEFEKGREHPDGDSSPPSYSASYDSEAQTLNLGLGTVAALRKLLTKVSLSEMKARGLTAEEIRAVTEAWIYTLPSMQSGSSPRMQRADREGIR